jgi:hypothetical protein
MSSPTSQTAADSGGAAFSPNYLHDLSTTLNIYRTIGGLEEKVHVLEITAKSNSKNIDTLTEKAYAISYLEREVAQNSKDLKELGAQHNKDLNELGRRLEKDVNALGGRHDKDIKELEKVAHTASTFGKIAFGVAAPVAASIIIAVLIFIYHHLTPILFPK